MGRRGSRKSRSSQSTPRDPNSANATPRNPGSANATPRDGPKGVKFGEAPAGAVALDGPNAVFQQQMTVVSPDRQLSRSNTDGLEAEESLEAIYGDNLDAARDHEKFEAAREQQNAVIETREQPVVPMSKQDTIVEEDDEVYDMHSGRPDSGPQLMSMMTSASAYQRGATRDSVRSSIADDGDTLDAMFDDALDAAAAVKDPAQMDRFKRMSVAAKGRMEQRPAPPPEQARESEPSPEDAHPPPAQRDPEDEHPAEEKPKGLELPFDTPNRGGADQGGGGWVCCGGRTKNGDPQQDECTIL